MQLHKDVMPVPHLAIIPPRRGRPRNDAVRLAILSAAESIVHTSGFEAVTMEAIAAKACVSKATIYRWWPNKAAVLLESVVGNMTPVAQYKTARTLREKFKRQVLATAHYLNSPQGAPVIALIAAKQTDPLLATEYSQRYALPRRRRIIDLIEDGVRRGELRAISDLNTLVDQIYGPIYYRVLVTRGKVTKAFVDAVVNSVFDRIET